MPPFQWEDIDHSLVKLRLIDLVEEMRAQMKADEERIRFDNRGNMNRNTVPSAVLKMKQDRADEWVGRVYEIYCDVWQTQGYVKSAAFVRGVHARAIVPTLRARTEAIASEFSGIATRTSFPVDLHGAHLQHHRRKMQRLEGRWRKRLEAEAKVCEHIQRRKSAEISTPAVESLRSNLVLDALGNASAQNGPASVQPARVIPADGGPSVLPAGEHAAMVRTLPNSQNDTALSHAIAAVSGSLLQDVTGCLKRLVKVNYESQDEIEKAPEWKDLVQLLCNACDTYADIAMGNRRKIKADPLEWVKARIEEDQNSISRQHFRCDRNGYFAHEDATKSSVDRPNVWRAAGHLGLLNTNQIWSVYFDNMERAASVALGNAAIRIASGRATKQVTAANRDSSQDEFFTINSAPLSAFESRVGRFMVQARMTSPTKYLPQAEIVRIAGLVDDEGLPVRDNLEREASRKLAEFNQLHPRAAIKSWRAALSHPQFRRAVRKRFSRAEEKYKKASPPAVVLSRGTSRTAI